MTDANQLLLDYAQTGSESAFRTLVARYLDLVYSVALRRAGGDAHQSEDIAQTVFTDLARKARALPPNVMLGGWLHRHTCFVASTALRAERRRHERERQAVEMSALHTSPDDVWAELAPVLDEAIDQLDAGDREVIVLRFFERRDLRGVGVALGISEDAAQKRVSRAVDRLRERMNASGVAVTFTALGAALVTSAVSATPTGLASTISKAALAAAGVSTGLVAGFLQALLSTKAQLGVAAALVLAAAVPLLVRQSEQRRPFQLPSNVASDMLGTNQSINQPQSSIAATAPTAPTTNSPIESGVLHLIVLAGNSGKPMPRVQIDYRRWDSGKFTGRTLYTAPNGSSEVTFPRESTTDLQLTTRVDGFADTRLHWRPDRGEAIPESYTLRLGQPVPIGGTVVDADGQPIEGAKVGWNHGSEPESETRPECHEFTWIEVSTDADGRWNINRIAPEMIRRLYGSAKHPDHVDTSLVWTEQSRDAERLLLARQHVFQLGRAVAIRGVVSDLEGHPVAGADVLLGKRGMTSRRETKTTEDGTFTLRGCKCGNDLLSAEADGFAATTLEVEVTTNAEPFQLVLQRGGLLRLRIVNQAGEPVPKANVWLNTHESRQNVRAAVAPVPVQANFNPKTDQSGRIVWSNAPNGELVFAISARGYMRLNELKVTADGEEHVVTLPAALVISGTVQDAVSGDPIPTFRIVAGWPEYSPVTGATNVHYSSIDRFWLTFAGGTFRHSFEEPLVVGSANRGYVLKFMADGYAPATSRVIGADEGEVQLSVNLRKGVTTTVTILLPDGRPAAGAEFGLASAETRLTLVPGGFTRRISPTSGSLLAADAEGKFTLQPDESISRVVVAHPTGYAEAKPETLRESPLIQLQPWGGIEGTYSVGGQPIPGRVLQLLSLVEGVYLDYAAFKTTTGAEGRFSFRQVPPSKVRLVTLMPGDEPMWTLVPLQDIEVKPGTTTTVALGSSGYALTGRLRWAEGLQPAVDNRVLANLYSPHPKPPTEMLNNPEALRAWSQSPEVMEAGRQARSYPLSVVDDRLTFPDNIPAGEYELQVVFISTKAVGDSNRATTIGAGTAKVTVPAEPPSGSLDVGEIVIRRPEKPPGITE